jgi:hypothetical protein
MMIRLVRMLNCDDFVLKGVYHNGCMTINLKIIFQLRGFKFGLVFIASPKESLSLKTRFDIQDKLRADYSNLNKFRVRLATKQKSKLGQVTTMRSDNSLAPLSMYNYRTSIMFN